MYPCVEGILSYQLHTRSIFHGFSPGFSCPDYATVFEHEMGLWTAGFSLKEKPAKILREEVFPG